MSDLMKNGNFLGQSYTILAGLNEVVDAMSSKNNLAREINNLGAAHFKRGVSTAMFEVFNESTDIPSSFYGWIQINTIAVNGPRHRRSSSGGIGQPFRF